jgi:hypothetical protein
MLSVVEIEVVHPPGAKPRRYLVSSDMDDEAIDLLRYFIKFPEDVRAGDRMRIIRRLGDAEARALRMRPHWVRRVKDD